MLKLLSLLKNRFDKYFSLFNKIMRKGTEVKILGFNSETGKSVTVKNSRINISLIAPIGSGKERYGSKNNFEELL